MHLFLSGKAIIILAGICLVVAACRWPRQNAADPRPHSGIEALRPDSHPASLEDTAGSPGSPGRPATGVDPAGRKLLVSQLRLMGQWLASGDYHQIGKIFQFPVADSLLTYFGNDSAFNNARARDTDATTAATFERYFGEISYELNFKEFNRLFQRLHIDKLLHQDSLEYDAIKKQERCYNLYRIDIREDSLVSITYGVNSRKDYHGPETKDPDFDSSLCEHDTSWDFVFDGEHLRFVRISAAD